MYSFFRTFGQTLVVAVGGVVFQNRMIHNLQGQPRFASKASELGRDAARLVQTIRTMPSGSSDKLILQKAFVDSLRWVWGFCTIVAGVALVSSVFVKAYTLNVQLETEQGVVRNNDSNGSQTRVGDDQDTSLSNMDLAKSI